MQFSIGLVIIQSLAHANMRRNNTWTRCATPCREIITQYRCEYDNNLARAGKPHLHCMPNADVHKSQDIRLTPAFAFHHETVRTEPYGSIY